MSVTDAPPLDEPPAPSGRFHTRFALVVMGTFVVVGVIAIVYSFTSGRTFEKLDAAARQSVAAACTAATNDLVGLGDLPQSITREQLAERLDAENARLTKMIDAIDATTTADDEGQRALEAWVVDWREVMIGRVNYTRDVRDATIALPVLALPTARTGSIKPITSRMEEYAQLHDLAQCTPKAVAAETVDGPRGYGIGQNGDE